MLCLWSRGTTRQSPHEHRTHSWRLLHFALTTQKKEPAPGLRASFNQKTLEKRTIYAWTDKLGNVSLQWRVLYKIPLKKRTGDLQWQVLNGTIAWNAFKSVINPVVEEMLFHILTDCNRFTELFKLLTNVLFSILVNILQPLFCF